MNMESYEEYKLECAVTDIIKMLGMPASIKGYHYIRYALVLAIKNDYVIGPVTKYLYPTVAKKFNTTPSRVERAMRHAIAVAWSRGDSEILDAYFGNTIRRGRETPTNSEFMALICDMLKLRRI